MILCYHGIAIDNEHEWCPGLYLSEAQFASRLAILEARRYAVLPFAEAVERLRQRDLPPRAAAITFDDGLYDFQLKAAPLLERYGFPATVYLTTYYSEFNRPIFHLVCDYMMWSKRGGVYGGIDLRTPESRAAELAKLEAQAEREDLSGREKDALAADLARRIGADWDGILEKRILHLLTKEEATTLSRAGFDFELHTHRHRTPEDRTLFFRELDDNARVLRSITNRDARHFCYPCGVHHETYPAWLREWGARTAVTTEMGLASADDDTMLLPRFCDHSGVTDVEFEAWLSGL